MARTCATPGCRFRDHHNGPHSFEVHAARFRKAVRRHPRCVVRTLGISKPKPRRRLDARPPNDFQLGIEDVREAIDGQHGVRIRMSKTAFCGHWPEATDVCVGKIVGSSREGRFVAEAIFDGDSEPTLLTSSSLMRVDTHVVWRKPHLTPTALLRKKCETNTKHVNAMGRASEMYETLCSLNLSLKGRIVLTLDGIGTNRVAGENVLDSIAPSERPETLTLEMNADVAFAQRLGLGFGTRVRFTGADSAMAYRTHSLTKTGPPTIENVLMTPRNAVLSDEEKRRVVWLNLDYCGGPPKNNSVDECGAFMQKCLAHLPHLHMITVTVARRNHADLDATFGDYFPTPHGFTVRRTYTDNARVVCKMYLRVPTMTRHVSIPGHWWRGASPAWKTKFFDGIVVASEGALHDVYVPVDDRTYQMRGDAVSAYADDSHS